MATKLIYKQILSDTQILITDNPIFSTPFTQNHEDGHRLQIKKIKKIWDFNCQNKYLI